MNEQIGSAAYVYGDKEGFADIGLYWQIILHEKKLIFLICAFFFTVSTVFLALQPNVYETEVQFLVEQLGDMEKISRQAVTPNFRGEDDYYGTQVVLITGKKITDRVDEELNIKGGYKLTARRLRGTRIIAVTVRSNNRKLAASVANKTIEVYTEEKAQDDLFIAKQMLKWLPNQIEQLNSESPAASPGTEAAKSEGHEAFLTTEADDLIYQQLRQQRMETESKINELSFRYKSSHPVIKELTEKLSYLDQQIKERKDLLVGNLKASLMGDFHLTNIKVLSPAPVPDRPIAPKRVRGILSATLFGFCIGILVILYMEKMDPRVWYESDMAEAIDVPFMGYIPLISSLAARKDRRSEKTHVSVSEKNSLQVAMKETPALADAAAFMRTHLFFSVPHEKSKLLMMSSTTPNEGKSTVVALFTISLASMGKKVLVIDADLRRPFLHAHLGIKNEKGLAEYLSGEAEMKDIVRQVPGCPLKIITGGHAKGSAAQLLSSTSRFKDLLDAACAEYEYVLVDAPPVLYIPDGLIIAKFVQGIVIITSAGMVRRKMLQAVKNTFEQMGRTIVGTVINRADHTQDIKYKKYFRQYQEYYGAPK